MSISISNQIYLLQNGSGTHARPLPLSTEGQLPTAYRGGGL